MPKLRQEFEELGTIRTVALNGKGALTRNYPQVVEVVSFECAEREVIGFANALESSSMHPPS